MAKIKTHNGKWYFFCPGCQMAHELDSRFRFNYDFDKPTFKPQAQFHIGPMPAGHPYPKDEWDRHAFIAKGRILFTDGCGHHLNGQEVEIPDWGDLAMGAAKDGDSAKLA